MGWLFWIFIFILLFHKRDPKNDMTATQLLCIFVFIFGVVIVSLTVSALRSIPVGALWAMAFPVALISIGVILCAIFWNRS